MIKKTICILLLIGAVAAVTFSALNSSKSQSQLMHYLEQSQAAPEQSEAVSPCDSLSEQAPSIVE